MIGNFYSKKGFRFFRKTNNIGDILDDRFVIENDKIKKSIDYINRKGITTITINPVISEVENIEFLKELPLVEGLYILQGNLDLSPINYLTNLRVLHLEKINDRLDFGNFKKLEVLGATVGKTLNNLNECTNLFWLWLDKYAFNNLINLSTLRKLMYLSLQNTSIENLEGIEFLHNLKELMIYSASKLVSLEGLSSSNKYLTKVDIQNAKNLHDYQSLRHLSNAENIYFYKTGSCEDFDFVKYLTKIKNFTHGGKYIIRNV